jgi:hypothetical protein
MFGQSRLAVFAPPLVCPRAHALRPPLASALTPARFGVPLSNDDPGGTWFSNRCQLAGDGRCLCGSTHTSAIFGSASALLVAWGHAPEHSRRALMRGDHPLHNDN